MHILHTLGSLTLSLASTGASMMVAALLLSAIGNQRGAATAFMAGVFLLAVFGMPAFRIGIGRAAAAQRALLREHIAAHRDGLYARYVALTKPGALDHESTANWRREVARFRRAMKQKPWALKEGEFYQIVTAEAAAMRERARDWGKRPAPAGAPVSITLPRQIETELAALGWRAKAESGPGLTGPVVRASKAGVRIVLRCERGVLTPERVKRALSLRAHYGADIAGIVCAGPITEAGQAAAAKAGLALLHPGALRAIYPRARAIWRTRKDKRHAMERGVRARAQAAGD